MREIKETVVNGGDANRIRCHFVRDMFTLHPSICENVNGEHGKRVQQYRVKRIGDTKFGTLKYVCNDCVAKNKKVWEFRNLSMNAKKVENSCKFYFIQKMVEKIENGAPVIEKGHPVMEKAEKVAILKSAIGIIDSSKNVVEDLEMYIGKYVTVIYQDERDFGILVSN